jgi:hypothetical protein
MIDAGESCIPSICRRDLPIILLLCTPSKEHDSSGHYYRFPAPHRRSSDAIDCNLLRPPSPLSHSVSLMHAQNPAEMDGVFSIQMSCVRDMNKDGMNSQRSGACQLFGLGSNTSSCQVGHTA